MLIVKDGLTGAMRGNRNRSGGKMDAHEGRCAPTQLRSVLHWGLLPPDISAPALGGADHDPCPRTVLAGTHPPVPQHHRHEEEGKGTPNGPQSRRRCAVRARPQILCGVSCQFPGAHPDGRCSQARVRREAWEVQGLQQWSGTRRKRKRRTRRRKQKWRQPSARRHGPEMIKHDQTVCKEHKSARRIPPTSCSDGYWYSRSS